ncbi:MAG: hypothetical protein AAF958_08260 [Planctomycetota bacterium]
MFLKAQEAAEATSTIEISPAAQVRPALRYRFWPAADKRRSESATALYNRSILAMTEVNLRANLSADDIDNTYNKWLDGPLEVSEVEKVKSFLEKYDLAFGELDRAIPMMRVDYELALENSSVEEWFSLSLQEVQSSRELARLISLRAKVAAAEDRWDDHARDVMTLYRLADIVGKTNDFLVTKLVSLALLGIADGLVREASVFDSSPNFYWALASVPESVFGMRDSIEVETLVINRMMNFDVRLPETPIGREAAAVLWKELAKEYASAFRLFDSTQRLDQPAVDLASGLAVVALSGPSREYLRENKSWGSKADDLSGIEAVLRATADQLQVQTGDRLKWALLPRTIRHRYIDRAEQFAGTRSRTPEAMLNPATMIIGLLLPAVQAANTATMRYESMHYETATLQALREHAARTGELPKSLGEMELPAWPDPIRGHLENAGYGYVRENATTAKFKRDSRWPGDQAATLIIKLVK